MDFAAYVRAYPLKDDGKIGVVTVAGDIVDGKAGPGTAGGKTIADLIHDALAKKDLKAIVLRVDSPGGSVLAADQIRSALMDAKSRGIPIVASMGNVARSEEHTSELQSLMRISYAVFCLKKKK